MEWIAAAVAAFLGGGLSGFFARPEAAARAEATRQRYENRRRLVADARAFVDTLAISGVAVRGADVATHPSYTAIRRHLRPEVREKYEGANANAIRLGLGADKALRDDLDRLDTKWKLS